MKIKLIASMAVAMLGMWLASCSDDGQPDARLGSTAVNFLSEMAPATKATDTHFDTGDRIGVFAMDESTGGQVSGRNYADNVPYTYLNERFIPAGDGIALEDERTSLYYCAVYPYTADAASRFTFTVRTDQSGAGYTQSDLCTAATASATSQSLVPLQFSHRLSKVVIRIAGDNWPSGDLQIRFINIATQVAVDLNAQSFTPTGGTDGRVVCAANGTNSYKAILPPQTIRRYTDFAIVTMGGQEYVASAEEDFTLVSGVQQTLTFTRNDRRLIIVHVGDYEPPVEEPDPDPNPDPEIAGMVSKIRVAAHYYNGARDATYDIGYTYDDRQRIVSCKRYRNLEYGNPSDVMYEFRYAYEGTDVVSVEQYMSGRLDRRYRGIMGENGLAEIYDVDEDRLYATAGYDANGYIQSLDYGSLIYSYRYEDGNLVSRTNDNDVLNYEYSQEENNANLDLNQVVSPNFDAVYAGGITMFGPYRFLGKSSRNVLKREVYPANRVDYDYAYTCERNSKGQISQIVQDRILKSTGELLSRTTYEIYYYD